jgi:hypothetical protein
VVGVCARWASAATNAAEVLDPALTRPGRFDSKVVVGLPDRRGRKEIIDLYLSKIVCDKSACGCWCVRGGGGWVGVAVPTYSLYPHSCGVCTRRGAARFGCVCVVW